VAEAAIESRFVAAGDLQVHLLEAGAGLPVFLLHGWPEFAHVWRRCLARLGPHVRAIAPDLRGFGQTRTIAGPGRLPTPDVLADDLFRLADALQIERFGIVSHDVGAAAAQAAARQQPQRIVGLFFFNCPYPGIGARWAAPDHLQEIWYQSFNQMPFAARLVGSSREACRLYIGHFLDHWAARPGVFKDELETWVDNFLQGDNLQGGFNWYRAIHAARIAIVKGTAPSPPVIAAPSYFLWGRHDPILKVEWTDRLGDHFSSYQVEVAEEAGHFVHYEAPDLASERIARFFRSQRAGGAAA
jgi:epoxide hydrolase 4